MKTNNLWVLGFLAWCAACRGDITITPMETPKPAKTAAAQTPTQAVADAKGACDSLKQKLLAPVHETAAYKQAQANLDAAQADLQRAKAKVPFSQAAVSAVAAKILADENLLTKIEQPALEASPEWKAASARLLAANKSLQAAQQAQARLQQEAAERVQQQLAAAAPAAQAQQQDSYKQQRAKQLILQIAQIQRAMQQDGSQRRTPQEVPQILQRQRQRIAQIQQLQQQLSALQPQPSASDPGPANDVDPYTGQVVTQEDRDRQAYNEQQQQKDAEEWQHRVDEMLKQN